MVILNYEAVWRNNVNIITAFSTRRGGIRPLRVSVGTDITRASHPTTADMSTIVQRRYERARV